MSREGVWRIRDDRSLGLSWSAKLVWLILESRGENCGPSLTTIAADCGISKRTAIRAIKELAAKECLKVSTNQRQGGGQTTNGYTTKYPGPPWGATQSPPIEGGCHTDTGVVSDSHGGGVSQSPQEEEKGSVKEKCKKTSKPQDHGDLPVAGAKTGKRGTRIPEDFREQLLGDLAAAAWFRENCPDVDARAALDEFIDYWKGVSGQRGCKLDWVATWRNRMRAKQEAATRFRGRGSDRLDKAAAVARKNRVNGQPSAAMTAFARAAGMNTPRPSEESRREITS